MLVKLSFPCVLFCIALVNINCICSGPTVVRPCVVICCNVVCVVSINSFNRPMEQWKKPSGPNHFLVLPIQHGSLYVLAHFEPCFKRRAECHSWQWIDHRPVLQILGPTWRKEKLNLWILTCKNPYVSLRGFQCFVHCWIVMRVSPYIVVVEEPMSSMSASLSASLISLRHVLSKNFCPEFNSQK